MVVGDLEIRPQEYIAFARGRPLQLTVRELDLLTALAERCDRIVSREELYRVVWEEQYRKSDRSVDVYIARLRQKLGRGDSRLCATSIRTLGSDTAFLQ